MCPSNRPTAILRALLTAAVLQVPATALLAQSTQNAPDQADACVDAIPCQLDGRSYHVKVPDDWDGVTPMPVMLHFHGWARQGTLIVKHGTPAWLLLAIASVMTAAGYWLFRRTVAQSLQSPLVSRGMIAAIWGAWFALLVVQTILASLAS